MMKRTALTSRNIKFTVDVPVDTLDNVITNSGIKVGDAILLKIDCEGYELEILKGLQEYWGLIEVIVLEMSILNRFHGAPSFSELTVFLWEKGYRFYNILNSTKSRPRFYDGVFVKRGSSIFDGNV